MEDVSVSKGTFAYGKYKIGQKRKNIHCNIHKSEPWYKSFKETWSAIENAVAEVNINAFRQILLDLEKFVTKTKNLPLLTNEIPTCILLAGINLPDHHLLFQKLVVRLQTVTPFIATIWSRDAATLKSLTEEVVHQIVNKPLQEESLNHSPEIKKSQCTFCMLHSWHTENNDLNTPIVIIIPDFESFSPKILHDFILILDSYSTTIKFVLIFGVATTLHVVHRSLSYDATSKLNVQVFHTQTQVQSLSDILDSIVLSPTVPFKLTGRAFKLLVDMFLWYDFSVNGFLQSYKICMWRHFYGQNEKSLCCNEENINTQVSCLNNENLKQLKNLESVKKYVNSLGKSEISDKELKKLITNLLKQFHIYINNFLIILRCLHKLTCNLPGSPLGKNFREIYAKAVGNISLFETADYKQAIQLISFLSKEELLLNIESILSVLNNSESKLDDVINKLKSHMNTIKIASLDVVLPLEEEINNQSLNRLEWKEKLKQKSQKLQRSPYKEAQINFIQYLEKNIFEKYLIKPIEIPMNEIFCYDEASTVNNYIRGSMKAAIHTGLNDPNYFLGCDCCTSENEISSMYPDLSIVYKLHLESRKMINVYDWLQAYLAVIDPNKTGEEQDIDPLLHARFTRAMAELQFLGFIKATRKKTDHVKRLT